MKLGSFSWDKFMKRYLKKGLSKSASNTKPTTKNRISKIVLFLTLFIPFVDGFGSFQRLEYPQKSTTESLANTLFG